MLIGIQGPSVDDYQAELALQRWWALGQRQRRPHFEHPMPAANETDDENQILDFLLNLG